MKNLIVFLFCFFLLTNGRLLSYTLDSNEIMLAVIEIGHYNNDGVQDTLIGAFLQNMDLKPKYIGWGIDSTNQSSGIESQTQSTTLIGIT